ncbi:general secretion pathway protein E [Syntrophus gentianae]|uniref:General secretion pathway protein E n=1 Tax=Syntrophus gentianae TaxID=43775 RepID=A0A1H8AVX3_9BACT|nr:GspE/PulE family protein [Syntrophus gentianae]SEM73667.1 general secretion pathway protein E [Syntrophus gentianae]
MSLSQFLKETYRLPDEDLDKARKLQQDLGGDIGQLLVQVGAITDGQRLEGLSSYLKIPQFAGQWQIDEALVAYLNERLDYNFLLKNRFLPLSIDHERKILFAVTSDPFNYSMPDYVVKNLGYAVQLSLASEKTVEDLAKGYLDGQERDFVSLTVEEDAEKLKEMAFEAPVIKFLNGLLNKAVEMRASDIHIESSEKRYRVRFRIDGILHDIDVLEEAFYLAVVSRIKLLAELDIAEKRLPQDGKFTTRIASLFLDIRVSTLPTVSGEGVVLRLLYREKVSLDLDYLGLDPDHKDLAVKLISSSYGMLLVTGPTGSGKTTTLYSMLTRLNAPDRKIITIEDPVEYQLQGINQIQVRSDIGLNFAAALRSILRHDPDIVMVGEIRDRETAEISVSSALTGHLVLSTLHTNDAPSSLFRLVEMGIEDYLLNAAILGVMAQRILRRNCPFCSRPDPAAEPLLREYALHEIAEKYPHLLEEGIKLQRGEGCPQCGGTGYRGRIAIFELFEYTEDLKEIFLKKMSLEALRTVLRERPSFRYLREDGILKVARGQTTLDEVLRVC